MLAAESGIDKIVELLLEFDAKVDAADYFSSTALHYAAMHDNAGVAKTSFGT